MQPTTLLAIEVFIAFEILRQLHKHNHKIGNFARAVALMLIVSHCGLLIFGQEKDDAGRRISPGIFYRER